MMRKRSLPHLKRRINFAAQLRSLRRLFRGMPPDNIVNQKLFTSHRQSFLVATFTIRFFYAFTLWPVLNRLGANWLSWRMAGELDLVWPVAWFTLLDPALGADLIAGLALISLLIVVLLPQSTVARILAFVGFFLFTAFDNSFGKINHDLHAWIGFMFALMFIPAGNWQLGAKSIRFRQHFLTAFWFGMALMSLFYTMSGIFKVYGIGFQLANNMVSAIHPNGLAYQVMGRLLQTNTESIFGPLLLNYPWIGWLPYIGAIYLELFSIVAVFRPRLHPLWGGGLIALHLGNWLLLSIPFTANVVLLALFFLNSPFRPPDFSLVAALRDLPLLGWIVQRFAWRSGEAHPRLVDNQVKSPRRFPERGGV